MSTRSPLLSSCLSCLSFTDRLRYRSSLFVRLSVRPSSMGFLLKNEKDE